MAVASYVLRSSYLLRLTVTTCSYVAILLFSPLFFSLTSKAFSPVIIDHELSTLRDPAALSELQDDSLTVKILPAVNEVVSLAFL